MVNGRIGIKMVFNGRIDTNMVFNELVQWSNWFNGRIDIRWNSGIDTSFQKVNHVVTTVATKSKTAAIARTKRKVVNVSITTNSDTSHQIAEFQRNRKLHTVTKRRMAMGWRV